MAEIRRRFSLSVSCNRAVAYAILGQHKQERGV